MIKLKDLILEILNREADQHLDEDSGATGKGFEKKFIEALDLVGLDYAENRSTGALWDIRPKGDGWSRLLTNQDVNIKIARTKWMFGAAEFSRILPWDNIGPDFNPESYKKIIRDLIKKKGVQDTLFLKPKDDNVQSQIVHAVDTKDVDELNKIMISSNFYIQTLGTNYDIRILTKDNYITSIIFDKGGKPFIRSERPRNVSGSNFVGFKAISAIGTETRPIMQV